MPLDFNLNLEDCSHLWWYLLRITLN